MWVGMWKCSWPGPSVDLSLSFTSKLAADSGFLAFGQPGSKAASGGGFFVRPTVARVMFDVVMCVIPSEARLEWLRHTTKKKLRIELWITRSRVT